MDSTLTFHHFVDRSAIYDCAIPENRLKRYRSASTVQLIAYKGGLAGDKGEVMSPASQPN